MADIGKPQLIHQSFAQIRGSVAGATIEHDRGIAIGEDCIDSKTFDKFLEQYLIKPAEYKTYNTNSLFSNNHIVQKILSNLLTNKDLCHLALKSKYIQLINWKESRNELLYRYAFLSMKLEDWVTVYDKEYDQKILLK